MTLAQSRVKSGFSWVPGVYPALILSVVYLPLTLHLRRALGLPLPDPAPWAPGAHPDGFTRRYWVIWLVSWLILLAPGFTMLGFRRTRTAGVAYLVVAGVVATPLALATMYLDYFGFMGPT